MTASSLRRAAVLGAAFLVAILSCGPDATGPRAPARYAHGISFNPVFPAVLAHLGDAGAGLVEFTHVRIVLHHADGTVALDTVVDFPPGASELPVNLTVTLGADAPLSGELLSMNLAYINAAGDTVFSGGPVTVNAIAGVPGQNPPPPVSIPVSYVGPGASATSVLISPRSVNVVSGDPFSFTAVALDAQGHALPGTPIVWASQNTNIATISSPAAGAGVALNVRGTATIVAQLLTGPTDAVSVNVKLPPSALALISGTGQTGNAGAPLAQPLIARVTASDGVAVQGVPVTFAVASGGGLISNANAVTDANGNAQTNWQLGVIAGAQSVTASASGLSGSPLTFTANALIPPTTNLAFTTQPASAVAGTTLGAIVVTARDASNATALTFTGPVTLTLAPAGSALSGTATVNAVAGIATFTGLKINQTGTYTLSASSGSLTGATSTPFNITPGPAASIVAELGNAQSGNAGSPLPIAFGARVFDAFGNSVPGVTVAWAVTSGGGNLSAATGTTDVAGRVSSTLTLGAAGTNSATASVAGVATPATFSATASAPPPGPATQLAYSVQPSNAGAGGSIAPAIVVQARDAAGAVATSFTGNITLAIGTNPGASTLSGTVTRAAVGGVATFNNISLNNIGAGYTLVATSLGLTSATSTTFTVSFGVATIIVADSGQGQSATASTALANRLVVRVSDSFGNPVSGFPVTWAVTVGGGSLFSTTSTTDVNGRARTGWQLGALIGTQNVTATAAGLTGSPITFNANATGAPGQFTWTGATNTSWTTPTNWSPNGVPGATDTATIVPITNQPIISVATSVYSIALTAGATLTNNSPLTITGNLVIASGGVVNNSGTINISGNVDATGAINNSAGFVNFVGAGAQLVRGTIQSRMNFNGTGPYTMNGPVVTGILLSVNSGDLDLAGQSLTANGGMRVGTGGVGTLTMTNPGSVLVVSAGNLSFQGASETGRLTAGAINFTGPTLDATVTPVDAGAALQLTFAGGTAQTYACSGLCNFGSLIIANAGGVSGGPFTAPGNVTIANGTLTSSGAVSIGGTLTDVTGGRLIATALSFTGAVGVVTSTPSISEPVTFSGTTSLGGNLTVAGNISVTGGVLTLGGHIVSTTNDFSTSGAGAIAMTNANDSLKVSGNASFAGGATTGLLTAGNLVISGNVNVTGLGLDATGAHTTTMTSAGAQTMVWTAAVANKGFRNLIFRGAGGKVFGGDQYITGDVTIAATVNVTPVQGSFNIFVGGNIIDSSPLVSGGWGGSSVIHFTGTPTVIPAKLLVNTIQFQGGATVSLPNNLAANFVVVDGAGTNLRLNGHVLTTSGNNFTTQNGGTLEMSVAGDSINAAGGGLFFNGGSTAGLLTAGGIAFGSLFQGHNGSVVVPGASASAFSPNAGLRAHFATGVGTTLYFKDPGTGAAFSHFWYLQMSSASTTTLRTDMFVDSLLMGDFSGANLRSDVLGTNVWKVTTKGINNSGTFAMTLSGVNIQLNDGAASSSFFNSVTWNNFPASYTGVLFQQNRTVGGPSVGFNNFSAVTLQAGVGFYLKNIGTVNLTVGSSNTGGCTVSGVLTTGQTCP